MPSKVRAAVLAFTLPTLCLALGGLTVGLWMYEPPARIVEKIVPVEKIIPCPPAQTGDATSKGGNSPAMSGSNNSVDYGQTPPPKKQ
jgi:hypothetical protein